MWSAWDLVELGPQLFCGKRIAVKVDGRFPMTSAESPKEAAMLYR